MADQNTITRIGGILKATFGPRVEEQQNLTAFSRKRYGKAGDGFRAPGDHFEWPARVGGNRAGISPGNSDDPLPTAARQQEKKNTVTDRSIYGVIKLFEKDILNAEKDFQTFISHKEDEMSAITRDMLKVINIQLAAGDGSGTLGVVSSGATSTSQTLSVGTGAFQNGSRYLQVGDVVDVYDVTLTTSRSGGAGYTVSSITRSSAGGPATIVLSASCTSTTGDVVIRGKNGPNKEYMGFWGFTHNQGVTFQGLSTTTYPLLQCNRINAAGQPLTENLLRSAQSAVLLQSGQEVDEYLAGIAQFDAYEALSFSQKRFTEMKVDRGFDTLSFGSKPFVKDVDVPSAVVYAFKRDTINFGEVAPLGFSEIDGAIFKWVQGYAAYTAYLREHGNMVYKAANQNAVIDTLSYSTSNPAYAL